jgi:hypothetical protein
MNPARIRSASVTKKNLSVSMSNTSTTKRYRPTKYAESLQPEACGKCTDDRAHAGKVGKNKHADLGGKNFE